MGGLVFASMGMTIATFEALGVVGGIYLDRWWHHAPAGLFLGIVLGTALAALSVWKLARRYL